MIVAATTTVTTTRTVTTLTTTPNTAMAQTVCTTNADCKSNEECKNGICGKPERNVCPSGFEDCDRKRSNQCETNTRGAGAEGNCGACGEVCPGGATCSNSGNCQCPAGQQVFTIAGQKKCQAPCEGDLVLDPTDGKCVASCSGPGIMECNQVCTNTATDLNNCGACGNVCNDNPANSQPICGPNGCDFVCDPTHERVGDECLLKCRPGEQRCPVTNACVNTNTDVNNCGACGNACSGTDTCVGGVCTPPPVTTCPTVPCPTGQTCNNGVCQPTPTTCPTVPCPTGQTCNNGVCQPTTPAACPTGQCHSGSATGPCVQSNDNRCGTSTSVCVECGSNQKCQGGTCVPK